VEAGEIVVPTHLWVAQARERGSLIEDDRHDVTGGGVGVQVADEQAVHQIKRLHTHKTRGKLGIMYLIIYTTSKGTQQHHILYTGLTLFIQDIQMIHHVPASLYTLKG
jgi:hypothetical protein